MVPDRGHGGGRWRFFGTLETEGGGTETRAAVKKGYPSTCGIGEWTINWTPWEQPIFRRTPS
jgi:hypothetical protein